jgi:acetyltransferase-like isoleucine patch superfamily enzyme
MFSKNSIFRKILSRIRFWIRYYLACRGNKIKYLRSLGVQIGDQCDILANISSFQGEPYLIRMGSRVTVTAGVLFITHDGATRVFRNSDPRWTKETGLYGKIEIGDNVFIGVNSILLPGISIGSNSVIGAGSVVTRDVPANSVAVGNPAKILGSVDEYRENAFKKTVQLKSVDPAKKRTSLEEIYWKDK